VATCAGFAEEERTHGILCGAVVEALGGSAVATELPRATLPEHEDVDPVEGVLRNVLSISCLSESIAVSLIGAERLRMEDTELRALLTRIYADEIGHARSAGSSSPPSRPASPPLPASASATTSAWRSPTWRRTSCRTCRSRACSRKAPDAVGVCDGADARDLFYATVTEVIVPRLEALGLPAQRAWETRFARAHARSRLTQL